MLDELKNLGNLDPGQRRHVNPEQPRQSLLERCFLGMGFAHSIAKWLAGLFLLVSFTVATALFLYFIYHASCRVKDDLIDPWLRPGQAEIMDTEQEQGHQHG